MANVIIYRPGTSTTYESQTPGGDGIRWTFNASVDGQRGLIDAVFPFGTPEEAAARACKNILIANPNELDGIV